MSNPSQEQARIEQAAERETHLRHLREQENIQKIFDESGLHFKIPNEQVLKAVGTVKFDADSVPVVNGVPLAKMLQDYATVTPHAVAERVSERHDQGESSVKSKADLKSVKDKVDFVARWGEMAFARLPATAPVEIDESNLTFEQYRRLPVAVKVKLVEKHGPGFAARLSKASSEQTRLDRLTGVPQKSR